jgi:hypothetical protein
VYGQTKFIDNFDKLTKDKHLTRPDWQINEFIKSVPDNNNLLSCSAEEKINWLTQHDNHPFRQKIITLKKTIDENLTDIVIIQQISYLSNGKFLDSIGVPGQSMYSDLIEDLCDQLQKINATP